MQPNLPRCMQWAAMVSTIALLTAGCGKNDQTVHAKDLTTPGVAATKAIAEEGFIYGLPLVMNYAIMQEHAVDKSSPQFKAPFNQLKNEARVFYVQGHGRHHPEQRHAVLVCLAGSARGADGDLGASSGEEPLLLGAVD